MTYRKGERISHLDKCEYLHIVEMPVTEIGPRLDAMYRFHRAVRIEARHREGRYVGGLHYIRWYFADPDHAAGFHKLFGGEILNEQPATAGKQKPRRSGVKS